jgi:hypothetical protein
MDYTIYNCTGTMTLSSVEPFNITAEMLTGTFSFTAVNPTDSSDVIQVTDGIFKRVNL